MHPLSFHPLHQDDLRIRVRTANRGEERLRHIVRNLQGGGRLVVVANREPYIHDRSQSGDITVRHSVGGLVTGIEPLLRASAGTWIAQATGSGDDAGVDAQGRIAVPPGRNEYTLRRIFIGDDDRRGFYDGLSNQALWPLCHRVYVRPRFDAADWDAYRRVNRQFAAAAIEELEAGGLLLVQDYHFALVPRLVRDRRPDTAIAIFWHIPFPAADTFAIFPWKSQLLDGLLGADTIGFHTRDYCLKFLDAVEQCKPASVDRENMTVNYRGHRTMVRAYPISVEWPCTVASREEAASIRIQRGIADGVHVSIGVDRIDYTKGLLERVEAVDDLLTGNPWLAGKYVLVQLASPSRTGIAEYNELLARLHAKVAEVNQRHGRAGYRPIILDVGAFSRHDIRAHYAMAQSALVTPLHDGMNLVAKEYIASNTNAGVLILSRFAGAAEELEEAVLVNPYDVQDIAAAIFRAIHMPIEERRARMSMLRDRIAANTIYDWSAKLVSDLTLRHRDEPKTDVPHRQVLVHD